MRNSFVPKLVTALQSYDTKQFYQDATAGVIVGIVALPLAIALAIASGVTPDRGLWTAIVAGFLISALGGSRVQIGGPTGAFVVIVYGIVQKYGIDGLTAATLMAGFILLLMGIAKLGAMVKFIPHPVITGFTSGIAIIIFSGEIKDLLGMKMGSLPSDFIGKWVAYAHNASGVSGSAIGVSALTLAIMLIWPRVSRRIPGMFVALILTTIVVRYWNLPVETVGGRFGEIAAAFPHPSVPHLSIGAIRALVGPAFTIALLAAIESLLSATVADGMIGGRHRPNSELIAQGVANLVSPLFGGIPATGAIARTATNIKNGGRTPVAGIIHSITLLLITLFFGRWAGLLPMATLAAILAVVSYQMCEWRTFLAELRSPKSDVAVLLVTFFLTVLIDLTVGISVGIVLASFLFIRRMADVTNVTVMSKDIEGDEFGDDDSDVNELRGIDVPAGVEVYEINGPFFFGAAEAFKDTMGKVASRPKVLIIRMREVNALDSSGMHALREVVKRSRSEGTTVLIADVQAQPMAALRGSAVLAEIGAANLFETLSGALARSREIAAATPPE
ncbi:MAG: sulfate permease [Gemmatimonadota bacterium]|nr:sulfate permease [Gemmatimonadota bacterium]